MVVAADISGDDDDDEVMGDEEGKDVGVSQDKVQNVEKDRSGVQRTSRLQGNTYKHTTAHT